MIKNLDFYYALLTFIANMHGLFLWIKKKRIKIINTFQKILDESTGKPSKIWVDEDSNFFNRPTKLFLQSNVIEMYPTHNEGKSIVAERFIRTLKCKIYDFSDKKCVFW